MAALRAIVELASRSARLEYSHDGGFRCVLGEIVEPRIRRFDTWSLSGMLELGDGWRIPVGWSGRGDGLDILGGAAMIAALQATCRAVESAGPIPTGEIPIVASTAAAAILVHEAVGHFAEAPSEAHIDLSHRLGFRIASEILSADDDPRAEGGAARYSFDDDGVEVWRPTPVLRGGRLIEQLHSLDSALRAAASPTANGRAASAWHSPIPRISNLVVTPGAACERELNEHLGSGLYIHQLADGFALGDRIEARIVLAEEVANGHRTGRYFRGGRIVSDRALLTRVTEVGRSACFHFNAACGKNGQILYDVGTSSPALRFSGLRVAP